MNNTHVEKELNEVQLGAVVHTEGPLLVLAGAGSGKTRIVTHRMIHLIKSGIDPREILAVTFTNKAAQEMKERVQQLTGGRYSPVICTFHSLGARILRESIDALGYEKDFVIYDVEDSGKLLRGCLKTLGISKEKATIKAIKMAISNAKNQLLSPGALEEEQELPQAIAPIIGQVYKLYQERLKEASALDFDDLLFLTVKLLQENSSILEHYQNRWPYLMIDEYQDTNAAQYLIARFIAQKNQNLFVVGDPDQSIYSWRGANLQNILNFENDYPGAKVVRLEQNYRSRTNILDAANTLIEYNHNRYKKNLWSDRGKGEKISLYIADDEREEAGFVTHEIAHLQKTQNMSLSDITIFYRTNFQSRLFEDFLLRRRIPYVIVGGISFYQRKEIKDLLSFLKMVDTSRDVISWIRTLNLPKRGFGDTTLEKMIAISSELQLPIFSLCEKVVANEQALRLNAKQKEGLQAYVALINALRSLKKQSSLHELLVETVEKTNYHAILRQDPETFEDRRANVDELIAKAAEWELYNDSSSLTDFLEELTLKTSLDETDMSTEKVNLMTLHNGKGLEFQVAFMVGMEEELFPHANSRQNFEGIEEERRLAYVGMTRAKEKLYLTAAQFRFLFGSSRMMRPSRFLREIPKEYIERIK